MAVATVKQPGRWKDPRTGVLMLRRRIPDRYAGVSGRAGSVVKISTGTADRKVAEKAWPGVLARLHAVPRRTTPLSNSFSLTQVSTVLRAAEISLSWVVVYVRAGVDPYDPVTEAGYACWDSVLRGLREAGLTDGDR